MLVTLQKKKLLQFIHWNVDPEIFSIGFITIRWYSLLFATAFLLAYYILEKIFKYEQVPTEGLDNLTVYVGLGTVLGARLGHCLFYDAAYYLSNPVKILAVWEGGLASHGAAIGILFAIYLFVRKYKSFTYLWLVDRLVITVALAAFCIRLGNLMNSEIVGEPTTLAWGFIFERNGENFARHPSQLYEAFFYLISFFFLRFQYWQKKRYLKPGRIFGMFLLLIFGFRFFIEFLKKEQEAFEVEMLLNMGQLLSLPLVLLGMWLLFRPLQNVAKH